MSPARDHALAHFRSLQQRMESLIRHVSSQYLHVADLEALALVQHHTERLECPVKQAALQDAVKA